MAAVLTFCLELSPKDRPFLTPLAGGTTNLIAWDLDKGLPERVFRALFSGKAPRWQKRWVLRLNPPGDCGMFLGGGLIAEGVARFRERRERELNPWEGLTFVPLNLWRQKTRNLLYLETKEHGQKGPFWAFLVTTMERLFGTIDPLPGCSLQNLRALALKRKSALWRGLFNLWQGRSPEDPARGIYSFCTQRIVIYTPELALDGEIYTSSSGCFTVELAGEVDFLTW